MAILREWHIHEWNTIGMQLALCGDNLWLITATPSVETILKPKKIQQSCSALKISTTVNYNNSIYRKPRLIPVFLRGQHFIFIDFPPTTLCQENKHKFVKYCNIKLENNKKPWSVNTRMPAGCDVSRKCTGNPKCQSFIRQRCDCDTRRFEFTQCLNIQCLKSVGKREHPVTW